MVYDKVVEIVSEKFEVDSEELTEDTCFVEDLNADSIELFDLIMTMEDEYGFELEDEELEKLNNIGNVVDYIEAKLN